MHGSTQGGHCLSPVRTSSLYGLAHLTAETVQPVQRGVELGGWRECVRGVEGGERQSASAQARPPGQQQRYMQEVIEQHLLPLASAFLELLCQSTFTLAREQCKTSHIATVPLQNRQVTVLRMRGLRLLGLQGLAAGGRSVR
jgi:hypothetical protein